MTAGLLKRSSLLLSALLGFVSWFVLIPVWTHSSQGGLIDRAIGALLAPASWLADRVGRVFFPDYLVPHSTAWYLIPLFGTVGQIGLLTIAWYVCIRIKRAVEPEQVSATPGIIAIDGGREGNEELSVDAEDEPVYTPPAKTYLTKAGPTIDYERFKLRTWREFHKRTGHWPLFSIVFHYSAFAGMLVAVIVFLWLKDHCDWVDEHSLLLGGFGLIFFSVFMVAGQKIMWRLDWKVFGTTRSSLR
jgi:hypothetical protein